MDSDETIIYDSDETVVYYPLKSDLPKIPKEVLLKEGSKIIKPTKQVIKAHPSRRGFNISVHGVRRRQCRTYLKCKIPHCKSQFPTIRDWNLHHHLIHNGIKLSCNKCAKTFRTPSFLRDHGYVHSYLRYMCEKCDKIFAFKSHYRIHGHTHLRSKIHKCFAGSCGREYKWPQDLHRHIRLHLNCTYGCSICDYTNAQKYLLKRHLKKHDDKSYYYCENCSFKYKWYTQLSRHNKKCLGSK